MSDSGLVDPYGLPIVKAPVAPLQPPAGIGGGWLPLIREPFTGAWQRNMELRGDSVLAHVAVFRCISLISGDIAKMRPRLITETSPDVWAEAESAAFSPVITKPNHYQNRIQFIEHWLASKLATGNTYTLKERDRRGLVTALYILDPRRVRVLVANNGDVFYQLSGDTLADVPDQLVVPASEVIHDRWNCLFHPLCGLSPIFANALAATQGIRIQEHSTRFFANSANPGGFLSAPGQISDETARRLKADWQEKFASANAGIVAVAGDGLKYEPMGVTALNSQLIEQLRWTSEMIAASYGVPAYKVGIGVPPATTNVEALGQQYYTDCLQIHIEALELCLDEGLSLPKNYGIEFDLDGLVRMDSEAKMRVIQMGAGSGTFAPDESRRFWGRGLGPVKGGDTPYLQQQNYSLAALAKRDAQEDPFGPAGPAPPPANDQEGEDAAAGQSRALAAFLLRRAGIARHVT